MGVSVLQTWRAQAGDPTWVGWGITLAYLAVAGWAWRAARLAHGPAKPAVHSATAWKVIAVLLLLLGLNKQLDFQTLFIAWGRALAEWGGWYAHRRLIQLGFVLAVGVASVGLLPVVWTRSRLFRRQHPLALAGLGCLAGYVLARLVAINHVGDKPDSDGEPGVGLILLEIAGLTLVGWAAVRRGSRAIQPGNPVASG